MSNVFFFLVEALRYLSVTQQPLEAAKIFSNRAQTLLKLAEAAAAACACWQCLNKKQQQQQQAHPQLTSKAVTCTAAHCTAEIFPASSRCCSQRPLAEAAVLDCTAALQIDGSPQGLTSKASYLSRLTAGGNHTPT